jgi:hypothetical protein
MGGMACGIIAFRKTPGLEYFHETNYTCISQPTEGVSMKRIVLLLLPAIVFFSACQSEKKPNPEGNAPSQHNEREAPETDRPEREKVVAGGWTKQNTDAEVVEKAWKFLNSQISDLTLHTIREAYTQIVAGTNIRIIADASKNGKDYRLETVIYKNVSGNFSIETFQLDSQ